MIAFFFVTSIIILILSFVSNNARQVLMEDMDIDARYLAMSGTELAYNALVMEVVIPGTGTTTRLINEFKSNPSLTLQDTIDASNAGITGNQGNIVINVAIDTSDKNNIIIKSTGNCVRTSTKKSFAIATLVVSIDDLNKVKYDVKVRRN